MKTALIVLAAAAMALAAPNARVFTGIITDDMCGRDHAHMGVAPNDKCVRECVKSGSKYALLVGDKLYKLSDQKTPEAFAARKVKVTGTLYEKTGIIAVEKIEAAK